MRGSAGDSRARVRKPREPEPSGAVRATRALDEGEQPPVVEDPFERRVTRRIRMHVRVEYDRDVPIARVAVLTGSM